MAISLSGFKQAGAQASAAAKLAKEYAEQEERASKRKGWSGLLGKGLGALAGAGLVGLTGLTGGLAAPLLMGAGSWMGRKAAHEATRSMAADTSGLTAEKVGKYGYGKKEAETLRDVLESQMAVDPSKERGGFGKDVFSAYMSAGLSGGLTGGAKTLLSGDKGSISKALTGQTGPYKFGGLGDAKEAMLKTVGLSTPKDAYSPRYDPDVAENILESSEYAGLPFEQASDQYVGLPFEQGIGDSVEDPYFFGQDTQEAVSYDPRNPLNKEHGGQVPNKAPTIADYFGMQNVSLDGSSTKSLSQILGRN